MGPHVNLSLFLQESPNRVYDPLHGHSFHRVAPSALNAVQHSRLFFRDCLICQQRVLSLGKANARKRRIPDSALYPAVNEPTQPCLFPTAAAVAPSKGEILRTASTPRRRSGELASNVKTSQESEAICQCVDCGNFVHRECLSQVHAHRKCRGHGELMPRCPQTTASTALTSQILSGAASPVIKRMVSVKRKFSTTMTISSLIDELSEDRLDRAETSSSPSKEKTNKSKATTAMRRAAPFLAAGGVLGAIALGPAAGVIAGLNVLVAGVSVEGMVAGLGFTAATAAATASHQIKKKNEKKRQQEEIKSGAWAMQICWEVKQQFRDTPVSDDSFRKDAEFLRRFQLARRTASEMDQFRPVEQFAPSKDEVYAMLFGILSTPSEFLSQVNAELGKAFLARHAARAQRNGSAPSKAVSCKETLQDARMYVAHLVGATMQTFPSLASTDAAVVSCSQAIERVIFDDIYKPVMGVVDGLFADENVLFYASLEDIRRQQGASPQLQLARMVQHLHVHSADHATASKAPPVDEHLSGAEQKLIEMMEVAKSPMHKLELLCAAFRALCCFADKLHQTAANADILIPIVCALLVGSSQFSSSSKSHVSNFVSQVAFTSYFTHGGGKGVEGYVLTTFQAALQVIAAVDLSQGPAKELEFFAGESAESSALAEERRERRTSSGATDDGDEFFDATEDPDGDGATQ